MANQRSGWIKLHRQIMDHPFYEESRVFSRHEAWEYLLLNANHATGKVYFDGQFLEVERGSFITSIRKLQERWKWSNTKVVRFLDVLEHEGMATIKRDTKKTVISVDKYGFFQGGEDAETTEKRHSNDGETTQKHTNKNVKKNKNEKNNTYYPEIEDFRSRYEPELLNLIDEYLRFIADMRKSKKIADSVVVKVLETFDRYSPTIVEYGIRTHMTMPTKASAQENYTFGIMRNATEEEARTKLERLRSTKPQSSTSKAAFDANDFLNSLKEAEADAT